MNKKGFTLIELLAVIVILAIIALIATPIVLNIIEDSKKSAFVQTGNGIVDAAEYYYMKEMSDGVKPTENKVFTFNGSTNGLEKLEFDGEIPKKGSVSINTEGQVAIGISNDKYCITKDYDEHKVTITDNIDECYNPATIKKLYELTTSTNQCISQGKKCNRGTLFSIEVSDSETHNFYVLSDDGNKITLIMDRNLIEDVEWINKTDYNDDTNYGTDGNNNKGPLTALNSLQERTSTWKNLLPLKVNTFELDQSTIKEDCEYDEDEEEEVCDGWVSYKNYKETKLSKSYKLYARLPKKSELNPWYNYYNEEDSYEYMVSSFLYKNLSWNSAGYWVSSVLTPGKSRAYYVKYVEGCESDDNYDDCIDDCYGLVVTAEVKNKKGIRPVIELYK